MAGGFFSGLIGGQRAPLQQAAGLTPMQQALFALSGGLAQASQQGMRFGPGVASALAPAAGAYQSAVDAKGKKAREKLAEEIAKAELKQKQFNNDWRDKQAGGLLGEPADSPVAPAGQGGLLGSVGSPTLKLSPQQQAVYAQTHPDDRPALLKDWFSPAKPAAGYAADGSPLPGYLEGQAELAAARAAATARYREPPAPPEWARPGWADSVRTKEAIKNEFDQPPPVQPEIDTPAQEQTLFSTLNAPGMGGHGVGVGDAVVQMYNKTIGQAGAPINDPAAAAAALQTTLANRYVEVMADSGGKPAVWYLKRLAEETPKKWFESVGTAKHVASGMHKSLTSKLAIARAKASDPDSTKANRAAAREQVNEIKSLLSFIGDPGGSASGSSVRDAADAILKGTP